MTTRISNTKFLTVLDPLPLDGIGWEAVALHVAADGGLTVMQRVYRATEMTGSKVRNDFGAGAVQIPKDDLLWLESLPSPLVGQNPLNREFLWRLYENGVLRHEFFGEDIDEVIAIEGESPRMVSISGRTPELTLGWGVHVPAWAEVQTVSLDDSAEDGSFTLTFGSQRTGSIDHNATAAEFETAVLAGVRALSSADLDVSKDVVDGQRVWSIRFVGKFIQGNAVPPGFSLKKSDIMGAVSPGGVQIITVSDTASSGSFVLEFGDEESTAIPHNADAATFKSAIVAGVSAITGSDINVARSTDDGIRRWRVEFVGAFVTEPAPDNPGFALKSSTVQHGNNRYYPSVSGLSGDRKTRYVPSCSDISQVDYYASEQPRTAASVFLDCLERCQARGIVPFITPLFSATTDSFNVAWVDQEVQEVTPGETLLSLMQRYAEAYGWEFRMLPGFQLQVVQGGFGVNRSGQVRFWLGGHQLSHTLARTTREMLTRVWVQTNENAIVQAAGSSSASALAREGWIDGFEGDISYAQQVASTTRDELARQAKLRSVKLLYNAEDDGRRLFSDFTYCDWIAAEDDDGTMHTLKVDSIAWRVGSDGPIDFEVTFLGE